MNQHYLSIILFTPLAGALILLLINKKNENAIRWIANLVALIGFWGSANRLYSAIKFFLYTLVGSVVMLLGILALYFYNHSLTGVYTFDVTVFHKLSVPSDLQWWVFLAFFLGFAIKVPMFPFHTWLPDAHTDAPTAGSVILAAVLLT